MPALLAFARKPYRGRAVRALRRRQGSCIARDRPSEVGRLHRASTNGAKPYKYPLVLTKKGEQAGDAIAQKIATVLREIDDSLTDEQRTAFYQSLAAVSNRLGAIARTAQPTTAPKKE